MSRHSSSAVCKTGAVDRSVACPLRKQRFRDRSSRPAHSFVEKLLPSSADSRRASCQLMEKECALNTGKLPPGGLPRNGAVM